MITSIKKLFKTAHEKIDIANQNRDVIIIDVRSPLEFSMGHLDSSINIPLKEVSDYIEDFRSSGKKVVLICRSGARSGLAADILKSKGIDAVNGGAWDSFES